MHGQTSMSKISFYTKQQVKSGSPDMEYLQTEAAKQYVSRKSPNTNFRSLVYILAIFHRSLSVEEALPNSAREAKRLSRV